MDAYLGESLLSDGLEDLEEPAGEVVDLDGVLERLREEVEVEGHLVHELVEQGLEGESALELLLGEGRGEEQERGEVEQVSVERVLAPHADALGRYIFFINRGN